MNHDELHSYLKHCRQRLAPADAGFSQHSRRRTPGLRREEIALLANVSVDYYARLEQGRAANPSADVVASLSRALRLSADEDRHLHRLAGLNSDLSTTSHVPPGVIGLIDAIDGTAAAFVLDANNDVLAWNALASALIIDFAAIQPSKRNMLSLLLFSEDLRSRIPPGELPTMIEGATADFNARSIQSGDPLRTKQLVDEFATSEEFIAASATTPIGEFRSCLDHILHPVVGDVFCNVELLEISDTGQRIAIYTQPRQGEGTLQMLAVVGTQDFEPS